MKCSKYPDRDAAGQCMYSGKFFCQEELVEIGGKMIGRDYVDKYLAEKESKGSSVIGKKTFTGKDFLFTFLTGGFYLIYWFLKKD